MTASDLHLSRRLLMAGAGAAMTLGGCATGAVGGRGGGGASAPVPINPIVRQRADAQIFRHGDGNYYMTASVPEYDRLIIRRSPTLAGFTGAEEAVIWRRPTTGKMGGHIWAPELHEIDGRWHMFFAAGDAGAVFHIRTYVMRCTGKDALHDPWELGGQVQTPWDTFTLDSTTFVHKGVRYFCWAQSEPGIATNSNLYLAPMATPTTLAKPPIRLTVPTLPWEMSGRLKVAEAPALLARNGKLFLVYSANATNHLYCLGMLTADADADIMQETSWTKSQEPVFVSSEATRVWGPGHNSFTVDEQGRDVMVYHGRDYKEITGEPLYDPNRETRVQRLYYHADGTPDFGVPVGNGEVPDRFSPVDRPGEYLLYDNGRLSIGRGALPNTQFRQKAGLAHPLHSKVATFSLEPILARGSLVSLMNGEDVGVELDRSGEPPHPMSSGAPEIAYAFRKSFRRVKGLAGRGVSFSAAYGQDSYLHHVDGQIRFGPVRTEAERASATFIVT